MSETAKIHASVIYPSSMGKTRMEGPALVDEHDELHMLLGNQKHYFFPARQGNRSKVFSIYIDGGQINVPLPESFLVENNMRLRNAANDRITNVIGVDGQLALEDCPNLETIGPNITVNTLVIKRCPKLLHFPDGFTVHETIWLSDAISIGLRSVTLHNQKFPETVKMTLVGRSLAQICDHPLLLDSFPSDVRVSESYIGDDQIHLELTGMCRVITPSTSLTLRGVSKGLFE